MKYVERYLAGIFMISVFLILIITSVEVAVYANYGYFEKEYKKYDVNNPKGIVNMEMDELISVTKDMMQYLRGNRVNLDIIATIDGEEKEFFNEREKSHMEDVRDLFVGALKVRWCAIGMAILCLISLCLLLYWNDIKVLLFRAYLATVCGLLAVLGTIGIWAFVDFTGAFYKFHALFFSDYEWIFDARTSRLINILPQGFFVDTAIRIVVIFILFILIMGAILLYAKKVKQRNNNLGGTYE
jgi:integral membrane protein (TIGR01906 family)